ncbi:sigma-70 family RNA polymerase sigma factor [Auritidibacter ignavus]|uniref:Sigma-70 family RNA polymerase sigma factor n=1 Tax=Auritidibacter ignavus TaxID=678932 RepID=A0AAJ6ANA9_9MICC|nr:MULTISPECIES: sigma-70 family RNA polymerase sigma factor [Auritidibacter]PXA75397.1 RNA polymerase subunit sigma [Auritidibacter sp. NML100628]WGH90816.1 sigma-70 family RNA polymerase sigma factor [Auritidibacter ignavus]WGH93191.1 sigma-70 family RNA polymerase sigma factor [Auritidibacter ignavus]WHS28460.1 sigma-70 family RNA polymerase sigma factor [Auritidibacter ignavus]
MPVDPAQLDLIHRAQHGDESAFATLVEGASRRMWAVVYSITGNQHDAEDAMQNALTSAWRNLHKFEPRAKFSTWAYRIAANAALQFVRARRDVLDDEIGMTQADTSPTPDEKVSTVMVVRAALTQLGEDFREALILREYGGLTYEEIATQQKIGIQTVKSRVNRARAKLREILIEQGVK